MRLIWKAHGAPRRQFDHHGTVLATTLPADRLNCWPNRRGAVMTGFPHMRAARTGRSSTAGLKVTGLPGQGPETICMVLVEV
jgi:hypothetical protein